MPSRLIKTAMTAALMGQAAVAIDPITAKGQYLFFSNNKTQFFIKGVAYQQGIGPGGTSEGGSKTFIDSLADTAACARDIPLLNRLGTNTIRVYATDPKGDHKQCMNALADAGIYVIADLGAPGVGESISRDSPSWNTDLFARYQGVIDNLGQYPNTIGFFAGNEVTNNKTNTGASAFIKAAVRDSKAYIKSKNFGHWLGVGYATNDDAETRDNLANYFNCGDPDDSVDLWGYNIYEWCGQSTFESSGYEERTKAFANYSIPAFFSEYGCNIPNGGEGRIWQETKALYSDQMNKVWSGGIVYEFFQEQNDYGLVDVKGSTVTPRKDFAALEKVLASTAAVKGLSADSYTPSNKPRDCPPVTPGLWEAAEALPPTPNVTLCENMVASSACVPTDATAKDAKAVGSLFGTICGMDQKACAGIASNPAKGTYGPYVMCNPTQQLTNALNTYYLNQKKSKDACDFKGQAQVVTPSQTAITPPSTGSGSGSSSGSSSSGGSGSSSSRGSGSGQSDAGRVSVVGNTGLLLAAVAVLASTLL